ncbi:MAG: hypothetical protein ACKVT2_22225 [Saprospiraceae bacterium]
MTKISHGLLVDFSILFPDEPVQDLETYFVGIDKQTLLLAGSYLLSIRSQNSKVSNFKVLLPNWFSEKNQVFATEVYTKLIELEKKFGELILINPESSIQFFEYCFENLPDREKESKISNDEFERNIFKAYITLTHKNLSNEGKFIDSVNALTNDEKIVAFILGRQFVHHDLVNANLHDTTICQFIKALYLFDFLSSCPITQELLNKFLEYYQVETWQEYLKSLMPLVFSYIKKVREAQMDIVVERNADFLKSCQFIDKLIVKSDDQIVDLDYRVLRGKPIYQIEQGRYRIIFDLFLIEKVYSGMYFALREINNQLTKPHKFSDFRSFYCDFFTEQHLFYTVISKAFGNRYIQWSGQKIKELGYDAEPDYYIRDGNDVIIFESKDVLINAEAKHSYDFKIIEEEIKGKLYYQINKKGEKENKAILQILNNVKRILRKEFSFDQNLKPNSLRIYPIIVVYHQVLNIAGINKLINKWFAEEVEDLKKENLPVDKIRDVVLIDIDTLILCQDHLKKKEIKLIELIDAYIQRCTINKKQKYINEEDAKAYIMNTHIPFSSFVVEICNKKKLNRFPNDFREMGKRIFL